MERDGARLPSCLRLCRLVEKLKLSGVNEQFFRTPRRHERVVGTELREGLRGPRETCRVV